MTTEREVSRTLVKSPPELWAECSDAAALARHLGEFGEIRITRLEPETAVAWEGEQISGTVRLEPAGWGTRVILTAQCKAAEAEAPPDHTPVPEPARGLEFEPAPPPRGLMTRLRSWFAPPRSVPATSPAGRAGREPEPVIAEPALPPDPTRSALASALDSLGQAHHRPYSRA